MGFFCTRPAQISAIERIGGHKGAKPYAMPIVPTFVKTMCPIVPLRKPKQGNGIPRFTFT